MYEWNERIEKYENVACDYLTDITTEEFDEDGEIILEVKNEDDVKEIYTYMEYWQKYEEWKYDYAPNGYKKLIRAKEIADRINNTTRQIDYMEKDFEVNKE